MSPRLSAASVVTGPVAERRRCSGSRAHRHKDRPNYKLLNYSTGVGQGQRLQSCLSNAALDVSDERSGLLLLGGGFLRPCLSLRSAVWPSSSVGSKSDDLLRHIFVTAVQVHDSCSLQLLRRAQICPPFAEHTANKFVRGSLAPVVSPLYGGRRRPLRINCLRLFSSTERFKAEAYCNFVDQRCFSSVCSSV